MQVPPAQVGCFIRVLPFRPGRRRFDGVFVALEELGSTFAWACHIVGRVQDQQQVFGGCLALLCACRCVPKLPVVF